MVKSNYKQVLLHLSLIGVFAFLAMSSSFYRGITSGGNDLSQHYQFAASIHSSLISGVIYPSFVAEVNHGFGDVALRFYPPFSYYVLASIYMLIQDWYLASLLAFFLVFLCGGIGVYLWTKEEFSAQQALIAAAIFTFAPYHLNQIYNTFLFAEFSATAIIPFCFLFLTRICQKSDKFSFIGLTVSFALLILTHLPLTIICSITLSLYGFLLLKKETIFSVLPKLIFSVFCALALSSFYWVRMITEMSWSKHSTPEYFSDAWDYRANFLLLPEHFVNFQDDVLSLWVSDLMLLAVIFLAIPTLILIVKSKFAVSRLVIALLIVFIFTIFMTTPLSRFIWDNLSFLQKVQFPWRWIGVVSLFGSILASIGIIHVSETLKTSKNILLPIGIGAILFFFVFTSAFLIKDAVYRTHEEFGHQIKNVQNAQSFDCWWAIWWQKSAFDQTETVLIENRKVDIQFSNSTERNFLIGQGEKGLASISTFYYPHWKVLINNSPVEVSPNESGLISFPVPSQQSQVLLYFQEPPSVVAAFYLSSFAWFFFLLLFSFSLFRHFLFSNPILSDQS